MTTAYFLLGRILRNMWAPGDARISLVQHASMTSRPKWEELARDGCCGIFFFCCYCRSAHLHALSKLGKLSLSEERTEAGYIFFVLLEKSFCIAPNGISEEYLFPNDSGGTLSWDLKKNTTESCTQCSCVTLWWKCRHNYNEYD